MGKVIDILVVLFAAITIGTLTLNSRTNVEIPDLVPMVFGTLAAICAGIDLFVK